MSINEAGIVKIGKQFASHRIKPTKKTLLQKIKQKIQDKITKPDRGDVIYMNTEEMNNLYENIMLLTEAVSNDDKGKLFEILHAKHMHPKKKFPTHYRDEISGKSPEETHGEIKSRIKPQEYKTIDSHAKESAHHMRRHLIKQGHNPEHITHVAWTSNGAKDVAKFTGTNDQHNDSDVMYRFKHPKTGKQHHAGVGLKYGSQKTPNIRNPGLESLETMTGATTLKSRLNKHKKTLSNLGYTGSGAENHKKWKAEKTSKRGEAAHQSKLETTRAMAKDIHKALSNKSHKELHSYIRNVVAAKTKNTVYRMHTRTSHNEAGSSASHHISEPSRDIDGHLSQFSDLHMDKKHNGGITVTIRGKRKKDGKIVSVLSHAIKGVSGPMKGIAASTKLHGYSKKTISEEAPVNVMGAGGVNGLGTAIGGIQGFDPILGATPRERKKKFKEFRRKALGEEKKITTKARGNGFHDVLVDGEKHPHVEIVNGSGGVSGYGRNVYGVHYSRLNKTRWIGSLQKTKRHIEKALNESGPFSDKPKKLEPLKYRLARVSKGAGPGAVNINDWLADKKRRKAEYKKEREERMKNRERRDENT